MAAVRQHYKLATTGKLGQSTSKGGKKTTTPAKSGKKTKSGYGKKNAA